MIGRRGCDRDLGSTEGSRVPVSMLTDCIEVIAEFTTVATPL